MTDTHLTTEPILLAIETSCDETAAAVLAGPGPKLLSNIITSQIPVHQKYGGVVPEIASRKHVELVNLVIADALKEAGVSFQHLSAVAVTYGPGLVGALLVGVSCAKALALGLGIPLIGVNHIEGHIYANFLAHPELNFPLICLVVSGGHTDLVYMESHGSYEILGRTRDDAAGEAFDKIARAMGLGYPGGPLIDKLAQEGNPHGVTLPRAFLEPNSLDFSFSGLKSAVLNYLNKAQMLGENINKADLAASFQLAVTDVLVEKAFKAVANRGVQVLVLAGGVAANSQLRDRLTTHGEKLGMTVKYPPLLLCTDNAAMIGCAAYHKYLAGQFAALSLNAVPNLSLNYKVTVPR
ncbi:MAG: tRNA (adenosine(37)-N6)-threonylcarbamoyltransferase complex transferase subunit TsaD [Carboxydocellales bacterium]